MIETQKETGRFGASWAGWGLIASSIVATPFVLLIALVTSMEGDWTYPSLLFPISYLAMALSGGVLEHLPLTTRMHIGPFALGIVAVLALLQFPAYAVTVVFAKRREFIAPIIGVVHFMLAIAAYLTFVFTGS